MRGFQPRSAAGAKEQRFADGGFVQGIKRAFGMDEERNAQIAAYRARAAAEKAQQQAQAQQQTPQPQQRAVTQYSGMSATQRREKELGLSDGGRVRPRGFVSGKGTGTSDSIKARLSNGEYVLPADTVKAVGVEALDALRAATHTPVKHEQAKAARGFFAGGTPGGLQKLYDDWQSKKQPWYMPTPRGNMEERTAEANYTNALKNHYSDQQSAPTLTSPAVTPEAPAQNPTDARLAAGAQRAPSGFAPAIKPQATATPTVPQQAPVTAPVQRMAQQPQAPAFDFDNYQPAPGQGAFRNEQTGEVTRLQDGPSPMRDTRIWKEPNVLPRSDARPAAPRQDVRAPVLNPNGGVFSSMVDFTNQAGQAVQAIAANKGMRNDRKDALDQQRVGLDAASTFAKIEQGDRALGIDGRRADTAQDLAALQADELGLRREAAGFQTRAAAQQEQLRNVLLDPKSTPEQRAVAQRNLAALSGKTAADRMQTVALPDTTNEMGQVVRGGQALVRVLEDGTVQQVPIGAQQGAALPPGMKRQIGTSNGRPVYEDMNGKRVIAKG